MIEAFEFLTVFFNFFNFFGMPWFHYYRVSVLSIYTTHPRVGETSNDGCLGRNGEESAARACSLRAPRGFFPPPRRNTQQANMQCDAGSRQVYS